jgi:hypothetical protein
MSGKIVEMGNDLLKGKEHRLSNVRQPIFIVGCGRSGTTLLFDLLSTHPGLTRTTGYPDGEDHEGWITHGKCVMAGIGNVHHAKYGSGINGQQFCLHMTREDLTESIVRAMHGYYWTSVLGENAEQRVINKQPHLSNKLDYVLGIFPDARIVHIVRDCEPMVASWLAVMSDHPSLVVYWPSDEEYPCLWLMPKPDDEVALARLARHSRFFPGGGAELWIDYWCKVNTGIAKQMTDRNSQLLTVRYEDLIAQPGLVLGKIVDFCDLGKFEFAVHNLDPTTAGKHAQLMTPSLREAIARQAGPVRRAFGYEDGDASPLANRIFP